MSSESRPPAKMYALFENAYARTDKIIPFDEKWEYPTNRYNRAVSGQHAPKVTAGRTVCAEDRNGLKYVFIGTRYGNVLVYEPYKGNETDPVYRIQMPNEVAALQLFHGSQLNLDQLNIAVGSDTTPNIGVRLEGMLPPPDEISRY